MASSARKTPALYGATTAPPPTPSTLPSGSNLSSSGAADLLSSLLHRLPPTLSLPTRRLAPPTTTPLPTLSFNDESSTGFINSLSSASRLGFLELTGHGIPLELACSAEADALALFDLPPDKKLSCFPRNWPLGYGLGDELGDKEGFGDSFCLDSLCSSEPLVPEPKHLASLREFTREMERVGLQVVEWLLGHAGFESPAKENPSRLCSFMWVARGSSQCRGDGQDGLMSAGFYPFAVGLIYQIRGGHKYSLLADSGQVSVMPEVGSVMVTIGDLAQVWSNGKLKKVRGRPIPVPCPESNSNPAAATTMTMSLLITLPLDSIVSPLLHMPETTLTDTKQEGEAIEEHEEGEEEEEEEEEEEVEEEEENSTKTAVFDSFPFEDYAWRVYHERLSFKDPLNRYRTRSA